MKYNSKKLKKYFNAYNKACFIIFRESIYNSNHQEKMLKPIKGSYLKNKFMKFILSLNGVSYEPQYIKDNKYYVFLEVHYEYDFMVYLEELDFNKRIKSYNPYY